MPFELSGHRFVLTWQAQFWFWYSTLCTVIWFVNNSQKLLKNIDIISWFWNVNQLDNGAQNILPMILDFKNPYLLKKEDFYSIPLFLCSCTKIFCKCQICEDARKWDFSSGLVTLSLRFFLQKTFLCKTSFASIPTIFANYTLNSSRTGF